MSNDQMSIIEFFNEQEGITEVIVYYDYKGSRKVKRGVLIGALAGLVSGIVVKLIKRSRA